MKKNKKVICFDLDNVLCHTKKNDYKNSTPNLKAIKLVNDLYDEGYYIKIFTARFMGRNKDNKKKAALKGFNFTTKQLKDWKLKYNVLIFGKPSYDLFVDDKSLGFKKNWTMHIKKVLKKL